MKSLYFPLLLLGVLVLAQGFQGDNCVCPQVKCPADDAVALCKCLNNGERNCKQKCPDYVPTYKPCPVQQTRKLTPTPSLTPKPSPCVCEEVYCSQDWPGSCHCANDAAQRCYNKCGGEQPVLQSCPAVNIVARAPESVPKSETVANCECEQVFCAQVWPDSCYCANAAAEQCHKKCGGIKPQFQTCPPKPTKTLTTKTKPGPSKPPKPTNTHKVCGGGRASQQTCDEGYICIADPYTPGCGPACDGLGICVKDKMCGGFAGFSCVEKGQVCQDDPRDDCDPNNGGADCAGLCVWPHKSLYE